MAESKASARTFVAGPLLSVNAGSLRGHEAHRPPVLIDVDARLVTRALSCSLRSHPHVHTNGLVVVLILHFLDVGAVCCESCPGWRRRFPRSSSTPQQSHTHTHKMRPSPKKFVAHLRSRRARRHDMLPLVACRWRSQLACSSLQPNHGHGRRPPSSAALPAPS